MAKKKSAPKAPKSPKAKKAAKKSAPAPSRAVSECGSLLAQARWKGHVKKASKAAKTRAAVRKATKR